MSKFIGILGGMGTEATTYFYNKLISRSAGRNDQEHLKVILFNHSGIPDRTYYILHKEKSPVKELVEGVKVLNDAGVDFIVVPCNTAHYFYEDMVRQVDVPILHMIHEIGKVISLTPTKDKKIGVLATTGTVRSEIYSKIFGEYDLKTFFPNEVEQSLVNDFIYEIKKGKSRNFIEFNHFLEKFFLDNKLTHIVLGCTEFSLIKNEIVNLEIEIIDSTELLVEKTYEYSRLDTT